MIDQQLLRDLGWEERLIEEVTRVAATVARDATKTQSSLNLSADAVSRTSVLLDAQMMKPHAASGALRLDVF